MASPQIKNGYTKIANELLDKIISCGMNGTEICIMLHIIRKTYGFNKLEDEISLSQFLRVIPVSKPCICKALKNLQLVNIIKLVKKGKSLNMSNTYAFNKNYDTWQLVKKSKLVKFWKRTSKHFDTQLVNKSLHTKETITKETLTKERRGEESESQAILTPHQINKNFFNSFGGILYSELCAIFKIDAPQDELIKFHVYWSEKNKSGTKQRWELETTFELKKRVATWMANSGKWNYKNSTTLKPGHSKVTEHNAQTVKIFLKKGENQDDKANNIFCISNSQRDIPKTTQ